MSEAEKGLNWLIGVVEAFCCTSSNTPLANAVQEEARAVIEKVKAELAVLRGEIETPTVTRKSAHADRG